MNEGVCMFVCVCACVRVYVCTCVRVRMCVGTSVAQISAKRDRNDKSCKCEIAKMMYGFGDTRAPLSECIEVVEQDGECAGAPVVNIAASVRRANSWPLDVVKRTGCQLLSGRFGY